MKNFFESFTQLIFPNLCICCKGYLSSQEKYVCDLCNYNLPLFELNKLINNNLRAKFWGLLPLYDCLAYLIFKKDNEVQKIMHEIKYNGNKELCYEMGLVLGKFISSHRNTIDVDFIIPVPLHKNRENQRGFNQAEILANGVSRIIRVPVLTDGIRRSVDNKSQTSKNRSERNKNTDKIFSLPNSAVLEGKHVLLLDDVITTGATILSCGQILLTVKNLRLSVAALAVTN